MPGLLKKVDEGGRYSQESVAAVHALADLGARREVSELVLHDREVVRKAACQIAGKRKLSEAVPNLILALKDGEAEIKQSAAEALVGREQIKFRVGPGVAPSSPEVPPAQSHR